MTSTQTTLPKLTKFEAEVLKEAQVYFDRGDEAFAPYPPERKACQRLVVKGYFVHHRWGYALATR